MKLLGLIALTGFMAGSTFAADLVDGKWECSVKGPDGAMHTLVATLNSDGMSLTGTVNGLNGTSNIEIFDAMNHGEEVMWSAKEPAQKSTVQYDYRGAIEGEQMKITITRSDGKGAAMSCTAKKKK